MHRTFGPFTLHAFPRLRSTSDHAAALLARGDLTPPAIVVADRQTAGRGRGSNTWWSGPGCLTVTFAIHADPACPIEQVPLYAAIAVRRAVCTLTGNEDVQLKWPNDLLFEGRKKLAGILCERRAGVDLVGLGLNIAPRRVPAALKPHIASLRAIADRRYTRTDVLAQLASELAALLGVDRLRPPFSQVLREYDLHHLLRGRSVIVTPELGRPVLTGRCEGLDASGRLLLRSNRRIHKVVSGTVRRV